MKFGIYVHIPYCLQQCPYCDFATVKFDHPVTREDYTNIVLQEIRSRNHAVPYKSVSTLYFGGGTPSLAGPHNIAAVINELKLYFDFSNVEEITLEINPGTVSEAQLDQYIAMGVTRFSVGLQTFNAKLLKILGREHSPEDTHKTLKLLKSSNVLYTVDLLFALPHQSMGDLDTDLNEIQKYRPEHVSAYCLTVPDKNPLAAQRPPEGTQVEMFYRVENRLAEIDLVRYEVSNYSVPGKESKHNSSYWKDIPYWGLGMSAHSYFKQGPYGMRFWNPPSIASYKNQVNTLDVKDSLALSLPKERHEVLTLAQATTDFCHTRLRTFAGLDIKQVQEKFGESTVDHVIKALLRLQDKGLVESVDRRLWKIAHNALVMSEQVFQEMTFLSSELN